MCLLVFAWHKSEFGSGRTENPTTVYLSRTEISSLHVCLWRYLCGVSVAITSTDRGGMNHGARFALWPRTLVQTGVFEAEMRITSFTLKSDHAFWRVLHYNASLETANMFYLRCNLIRLHQFQKEEKDLGFICDYLFYFLCVCGGNCVATKNEKGGQCGVTVLCPVWGVGDRNTHRHTKPIHFTWQDFEFSIVS